MQGKLEKCGSTNYYENPIFMCLIRNKCSYPKSKANLRFYRDQSIHRFTRQNVLCRINLLFKSPNPPKYGRIVFYANWC